MWILATFLNCFYGHLQYISRATCENVVERNPCIETSLFACIDRNLEAINPGIVFKRAESAFHVSILPFTMLWELIDAL